jgi:acyl carrier protein
MEGILAMLAELRPEFDFVESENFIADGLLDSFDVVSLTNMLEEKYGITIDGLDIVPENYATVEAIAGLVKKSGGTVK